MNRAVNSTYLKDYQPSNWLIDTVDLVIDLRREGAQVHSRLEIRVNEASSSADRDLHLKGVDLELVSLALDGAILPASAWRLQDDELVITGLKDRHRLEIVTRFNPATNTELSGLYLSDGIYCTQCEAEGFRRITYFIDRPDVMALYTTTIQADKATCPVLLANGNLMEQGDLEGGRHWARWQDPFPKPCYLFAMVAGQLEFIEDQFVTGSGRQVTLRIFTEAYNVHKCGFAMAALKRAMAWDEKVYGREYDLDIFMIVAVDAFNMGAMENKGLNIFNASLVLAQPDATTDESFSRIEGVVAHEYFHNWTGNRITCRDWFQITLKEGLTVFRDQEFSADMGSRAVMRLRDVQTLRQRQFPEDASPMAHAIQPVSYQKIDNFYTATVYEKGAEVIRMMHTLLGARGYRRGTDCYFDRHDGQAVTTEDFVASLEEGSGADLRQFRRWYRQIGTPVIEVQESWNETLGEYNLDMSQHVPGWVEGAEPGPLLIPMAMGLLDDAGDELPVVLKGEKSGEPGTRLLELREDRQRFTCIGLAARPHLSLLRNFSAPVRLERKTSQGELAFLAAHDTDPFARWEAGQRLYLDAMLDCVAELKAGRPAGVDAAAVSAWAATLADADRDPAFIALALQLPGYLMLEQELPTVPVEELLKTLDTYRKGLATALKPELLALYERYSQDLASRPHDLAPRSSGQRALKNLCLSLLNELEDAEPARMAKRQFDQAACMSDTMGALNALTHSHTPERQEVLDAFAAKWGQDPVVMNSWFSVQAMSRREDTLEKIRQLMKHSAFDIRNPNKVRALIGAFAQNNPARFHEIDGGAYRFYTERVLEVDALNSQMGASLVRNLMSWRRFETPRSHMLKEQLEHLAAAKGLSPNAYEIVSRSLASV